MQYEYSNVLILFGLSLLVLRRIIRRSAKLDSTFEDLYLITHLGIHVAFTIISLVVTASIWICILANIFLLCLHYSNQTKSVLKFAFWETPILIKDWWQDLRILPNRKVKAYRVLPGSRLIRLGRLFLPNQQLKALEENIGDMRLERREALDNFQYGRARMIVYVYYIMMIYSTLCFVIRKVWELVGLLPKANKKTGQ